MVAVPDLVMFPLARGVPAVGRTVRPLQVMREVAPPPVVSSALVTVVVMLVAVTAMFELSEIGFLVPDNLVTVAVAQDWARENRASAKGSRRRSELDEPNKLNELNELNRLNRESGERTGDGCRASPNVCA